MPLIVAPRYHPSSYPDATFIYHRLFYRYRNAHELNPSLGMLEVPLAK
jgi:hypothetical protein